MCIRDSAQTPFGSKQLFFLPCPSWPRSLSLACAGSGVHTSRTAPEAEWAPAAGSPQASRTA
eukprot:3961737-Alexandrium_andersonii.AAC.1